MNPQQKRFLALCLALVVLPLIAGCETPKPEARQRSDSTGKVAAPDLELKCLNGKTIRLSDYRGKVVVLNFWATWCLPCRVELPHFAALYSEYKDQDVVVIGFSLDHEVEVAYVKQFAEQAGMPYVVAKVEDNSEIMKIDHTWSALEGIPTIRGFGEGEPQPDNGSVMLLPTTFLIDKAGYIYRKHVGPRERRHLEPDIKRLLAVEDGTSVARRD